MELQSDSSIPGFGGWVSSDRTASTVSSDLQVAKVLTFWRYKPSITMTQKNETTVLVLALLITLGIVGGGWLVHRRYGNDLGGIVNNQVQPSGQSNVESFAKVQNVPSGLFSYGGSTTPIRGEVDPRFKPFGLSFGCAIPTQLQPGLALVLNAVE